MHAYVQAHAIGSAHGFECTCVRTREEYTGSRRCTVAYLVQANKHFSSRGLRARNLWHSADLPRRRSFALFVTHVLYVMYVTYATYVMYVMYVIYVMHGTYGAHGTYCMVH